MYTSIHKSISANPQLYTHELHLYTNISETHLATIPQSDPETLSDTSTSCHGSLLYLFCWNFQLSSNVGSSRKISRNVCTWSEHGLAKHQFRIMMWQKTLPQLHIQFWTPNTNILDSSRNGKYIPIWRAARHHDFPPPSRTHVPLETLIATSCGSTLLFWNRWRVYTSFWIWQIEFHPYWIRGTFCVKH